ncbi:hypothetical protein [Bifidobacterium margollesii]|uniref:hypothetical protein n=1 Tax=Bifidobacterium margollesii TaxID=2020964 RepID=UPI0013FD9455|nr:hypothetical protein [Bifidobacterium margollesii]
MIVGIAMTATMMIAPPAAFATESGVGGSDSSAKTSVATDAVASVDGTGYDTLTEAIAAAKEGQTVRLDADVTESVVIDADATIILDLNGYTLTNTAGDHTIVNKGTLTIKDGSAANTGTVDNISNARAAIYNHASGTVTLESGNYTRSAEASTYNESTGGTASGGNSYYVLKNFGAMTITGGTVKFSDGNPGYESSLIANGWYDSSDGGADSPYGANDGAKLTISGGTLTGGKIVVKNDDYGVLTMTGGTVTQTTPTFYAVFSVHKAAISGGTITAPRIPIGIDGLQEPAYIGEAVISGDVVVNSTQGYVVRVLDKASLKVTGGTLNSGNGMISNVDTAKGASIAISGGSFNVQPTDDELAAGYTVVRNADGTFGASTPADVAATLTTADGDVTSYASLAAAVADANKTDDVTVTITKSVTDHSSYTFNRKVTVTASDKDVSFNGLMRFTASGSKISGIDFVIDNDDLKFNGNTYQSGVQQNVIISAKAESVEIANNTFTIASVTKGQVDFQPSSIWLEQGVKGTNIHDNAFNLGRSHNNSAVGVNFVGGKSAITDTKVNDNTVTFTKDAAGVSSGSAMFIVANGNTKGSYGVQGLEITGNVVDGSALAERDYALAISDVKDVNFSKNTVTGTYMAVSPSYWSGSTSASTGLQIKSNTLEDNTANVYLNALFDSGAMTPDDVDYGTGADANVIGQSNYRQRNPYISGMAFVGWYADKDHTIVATADTKAAYAKMIPIDEAYVFEFPGASLRVDDTSTYDVTSLRFGYRTKILSGDITYRSASWTYAVNGKNYTATAQNPYVDTAGYTVNNLVFTNVPKASYGTDISVRMGLTYTTPDGTSMTVSDANVQTRSVRQVAERIVADADAGQAVKDYAQRLLDAMTTADD